MSALLRVAVPPGSAHAAAFPDTDPDSGTVAFTGRPARAAWAVGQDLLAALGKRDDVTGAGRNHDQDVTVIHAWLSAHRVRLVVARHADFLSSPLLDALTLLCAAAGTDLALVHDEGTGQHVVDHVERHGGATVAWDTVALQMPPVPATTTTAAAGFPVYLPRVAFSLFRAACRDLLPAAEHAEVDRLYQETFRTWRTAAPASNGQAHATLSELLAACAGRPEALVVVRAAQASALALGHNLKADLRTLLAEVDAGRHRRMRPAELRSLRAYRQPWRAAVVVLRDADLPAATVAGLRLGDVDRDGHLTGQVPRLGTEAATYLRAQRTWRLLDGAAADDPLFEVDGRHLHNGYLRAGTDLNLPVEPANVALDRRRSDRWQHVLGVALVPASGRIAPGAPAPSASVR